MADKILMKKPSNGDIKYGYLMGDSAGIDRLHKFATACGFGQKTGIDFPTKNLVLFPPVNGN